MLCSMKYITHIIKLLVPKHSGTKPLGRWSIETCNKKIDNKVDLSNEDHCGPCGQYTKNTLSSITMVPKKEIQKIQEKGSKKES